MKTLAFIVYWSLFSTTLFIGTLLTSRLSAQQEFSISRTIYWKTPQVNMLTGNIVPNFDGAVYLDFDQPIPYYSEQIPLSGYNILTESSLEISETEHCETSVLSDIKNLSTEFSYKVYLVSERGKQSLRLEISTLRNRSFNVEYLKNFTLHYKLVATEPVRNAALKTTDNSVLRTGKWLKIPIKESGVYKITYDELKSMGFADAQKIRIFGNATGLLSFDYDSLYRPDDLTENKLMHAENAVFFYAQGPLRFDFNPTTELFDFQEHYYSDYTYYFLSSDYDSGFDNSIPNLNSTTENATFQVNTFSGFGLLNENDMNWGKSGRIWYSDDAFDTEPQRSYKFTFPGLTDNSTGYVEITAAAAAKQVTSMSCSVNGSSKNFSMGIKGDHGHAEPGSTNFTFNSGTSDVVNVDLTYTGTSGSIARLDYILLNVTQNLNYSNTQLQFRTTQGRNKNDVVEYQLSGASNDLIIWNLSKKEQPQNCIGTLSGSTWKFKSKNTKITEYIAFKTKDAKRISVSDARTVTNQNLHALSGETDMIIITHPKFLSYAQELAELHQINDEMNVAVATIEQVYNEFSSGTPDVSAYRDFARFIYDKGNGHLRYLLLFGDGSYDNKGILDDTDDNYILTYESLNSETANTYVTDDFFGFLEDKEGAGPTETGLYGSIDIGIGRIPASDEEQAEIALNKIKMHINPESYLDWRNQLCFIADDQDKNQFDHIRDADTLTEYIYEHYPQFNIEKLYLDAFQQYTVAGGQRYPDVNSAIKNRVQSGVLIINYTGHGGPVGLADERIISVSEINDWYNPDKQALWVTATCEFTPFDHSGDESAGELLYFNPTGGAFALFTTVRLAYIGSNAALTKQFYSRVFQRADNGEPLRLGDISRLTKNAQLGYNTFVFVLLGDPALKVGYAENLVRTTSINNITVEQFSDTIKAFDFVTFQGEVTDSEGVKLSDFNGKVYPTVYDKSRNIKTLNNDGFGSYEFRARDNIVYKGAATVTNGEFGFSFIVPRDIQLSTGTARVSYYAQDGKRTAAGADENFLLGGISATIPDDNEGPEIRLFMNDSSFVNGGITDSNPMIYAMLWDKNGINTSSGGVGHDITAVIDENTFNTYILNSGYRADTDNYQAGTVSYYLSQIPTGNHTLRLKAWDVLNNSSSAELDFVVADEENLIIEDLIAYPNPFSDQTQIWFEHNAGTESLNITLDFFSLSGAHIGSQSYEYQSESYRAGPFVWNGTGQAGGRLPAGMYIYRVTLTDKIGRTVQAGSKVLIIR